MGPDVLSFLLVSKASGDAAPAGTTEAHRGCDFGNGNKRITRLAAYKTLNVQFQ